MIPELSEEEHQQFNELVKQAQKFLGDIEELIPYPSWESHAFNAAWYALNAIAQAHVKNNNTNVPNYLSFVEHDALQARLKFGKKQG